VFEFKANIKCESQIQQRSDFVISSELKMRVAQNCPGYHPRYIFSSMSMGTSSESCNNCVNFVRGKCSKNLFDDIKETIRIN